MVSKAQGAPSRETPPTRAKDGAHIGILATLQRTIFLVSLPFGILTFVLPIYGQEIGATAVQIGLFFSAFSLMTVLLRPLVGIGLDRFGRRPFLIVGLAAYGFTMFAFAFSQQVWAIVTARLLQGLAAAFLWLSSSAITADVASSEDRGRAFGIITEANMRGGLVGTFVGFGVLMTLGFTEGWLWLFIGYGLVSLAAAILTWRQLSETNPRSGPIPRRPIGWTRPMILLLLVTLVTAASWAMVSPILMIFLQQKLDVRVAELAIAYLPAALVWAVLPGRLGGLADRFGRKPLMLFGMAVAAASSFLIPGLSSLVALAALWALQAVCYAAGDPAEQALVADLTGGDQRGRAYGLYTAAAGLGAAAGPLVGGWLYDSIGVQAPFYANGIVLALSTLALWALLEIPARTPTRPLD